MTRKVITLEFVVPTVLAIALATVLSIGAVYLTEMYLGPIEQAEAHYSAAAQRAPMSGQISTGDKRWPDARRFPDDSRRAPQPDREHEAFGTAESNL